MVNLLDVSEDDHRLLDAFDMLLPDAKSAVLKRLSVAACCAVLARSSPGAAAREDKTPEQVAEAFLMRCMPTLPIGYLDDFGFEHRYGDFARPVVEWRCMSMVLGSSTEDSRNATELAEALTECAMRAAPALNAPDFSEDGFVDADDAQAFIEQWRENFTANLARAAAQHARQ